VTKRVGEIDEKLTSVELENSVSANIRWRSLGVDMVPIFEEHSVRLERNYDMESWYALSGMERAIMVAQRRIDNAMKNHQTEAEARQMKKSQKGMRKR
jgi:hypothetical protein